MPDPDPQPEGEPAYEPLEPDRLTWAVLLARWTEFARTSIALPAEGEPGRVRQSVADIITLQAVWFSLNQLDELDRSEQAIGLDRAGVLIDRHIRALNQRFRGHPIPAGLQELMDDVQAAYRFMKTP